VADAFPLSTIPPGVHAIARRLRDAGHEVWYVGGAVRDVFLAARRPDLPRRVGDFDITTSATPDEVRRLFPRTVPVGVEHGTVAVLDDADAAHEVTTFRKDVQTDGRHAVVQFGVSLEEDLARRDFTINAIAVHPESGALVDPFDGHADLAAGVVRAVGEPAQRFLEDRLRVLRALRFAAVLGFEIEPRTWEALLAQAGELSHLSRERVRDEWLKTLQAPSPGRGIRLWRNAQVLGEVWPELRQLSPASPGRIDATEVHDPVLLTAAVLWHAEATPGLAEAAVRRLRFSNRDVALVRGVVAALADTPPAPGQARDVRHWLSRHRDVAHDALAVSEPRARRPDLLAAVQAVEVAGDPLSVRELAVSGDDLKASGIVSGKAMGDLLRVLLDEVLDEPWRNSRENLLKRARELAER
jgi:tRNA nucleotidyltransferase (CCA-adding enzyme)